MKIHQEDLANKTILEVGSGRGGTTRELVDSLSGQPGASLIAIDISDKHFHRLREEFQNKEVQIQFICTSACELDGVQNNSIDCLVCNYTLCAVNSQTGLATLALRRFWEVLKPGGKLFITEEFPMNRVDTPQQTIWAEKWRILKSATILVGGFPYTEFSPDILASLCQLIGFEDVEWTVDIAVFQNLNVLDFFQTRLERLLPELPNDEMRGSFARLASALREKATQAGGMEIPFYQLTAHKP